VFQGSVGFWHPFASVAFFPFIVWAYFPLARKEDATMIEKFGDECREYQRCVPIFFPRWGEWRKLLGYGFIR